MQLLGKADTGVADGSYRGSLVLHQARGGLAVVNELALDDYVQGVVPGEMPANWHPEALKSQAVAARSYAVSSPPRSKIYDHLPDTRSQVYTGVSGEQPESTAAVQATSRQVLTYRGDPITAFFFSTSGGRTENAENSFVDSGPQPYLVSVRDPYDRISPRHRSELRYSGREMARRLRSRTAGRFVRVQVTKRGVSPRIVRARIVGTKGAAPIDGGRLRTLLDLPDTWASFYKVVSWGGRGRIAGWFEPRRSGRVVVERRVRGRWRRAARAPVSFTGDFSVRVRRRGVYRVRAGKVTGPAVRSARRGAAGRARNSPTPAAVTTPSTGMAIFAARGPAPARTAAQDRRPARREGRADSRRGWRPPRLPRRRGPRWPSAAADLGGGRSRTTTRTRSTPGTPG